MTRITNNFKTLLFASSLAVSIGAIGTVLTTNAQESVKPFSVAKEDKPLDNLGEIADKPKYEEKQNLSLYDKDEKVGESVSLENLTRKDKLGNTNKEFDTFEDAENWAEKKLVDGKIEGYSIVPIVWSDQYTHSYTVEAKISKEVKMNVQ